MKKNVSMLLVAILMLVSLLAGCSGQTAEDTPAPAEQKQTDNQNSRTEVSQHYARAVRGFIGSGRAAGIECTG